MYLSLWNIKKVLHWWLEKSVFGCCTYSKTLGKNFLYFYTIYSLLNVKGNQLCFELKKETLHTLSCLKNWQKRNKKSEIFRVMSKINWILDISGCSAKLKLNLEHLYKPKYQIDFLNNNQSDIFIMCTKWPCLLVVNFFFYLEKIGD